jgi:hypothetical protein
VNYIPHQGTLTFEEGEVNKLIDIEVRDDGIQSCRGTLNLEVLLDQATVRGGAAVGVATADVSILDTGKTEGPTGVMEIRHGTGEPGPSWTATTDVSWLTLDTYTGTGPSRVTVRAEASAMTPGTYLGTVRVTMESGQSRAVPVTLLVLGPPE